MRNKVIKNWTHCLKVDTLSAEAEIFLTRLYMCVDPNGCFYAMPKLLRANLFPLRIDTLADDTIQGWLNECVQAGIIETYTDDGMPYLYVKAYQRKLRPKRDRLPTPPGFVEEQDPSKPSVETTDTPIETPSEALLKKIPKELRESYCEYLDWKKLRSNNSWLFATDCESENEGEERNESEERSVGSEGCAALVNEE